MPIERIEVERYNCKNGKWGHPDSFSGPHWLSWYEMVTVELEKQGFSQEQAHHIIDYGLSMEFIPKFPDIADPVWGTLVLDIDPSVLDAFKG